MDYSLINAWGYLLRQNLCGHIFLLIRYVWIEFIFKKVSFNENSSAIMSWMIFMQPKRYSKRALDSIDYICSPFEFEPVPA